MDELGTLPERLIKDNFNKKVEILPKYRYWVRIPADVVKEFESTRKMFSPGVIIREAIKLGLIDEDDLCSEAGREV